jgi:hypothetical protein
MTNSKGWKTATDAERAQEVKKRISRGAAYINSELEQFVPLDGDNCIRIVPPFADDDMATLWGVDVWTYYIGGKAFLSPEVFDEHAKNPVQEVYKKLKIDDPEKAKLISGTKRTILFVLDLNDPNKAVLKIWAAPPTLINEFIAVSKNRRTGQVAAIEDPEHGKAIFFTRIGTGVKTEYKGVQLDAEPYPLEEKWLDQMDYFSNILVEPDIDDLKAALADFLDAEEPQKETTKFSRRAKEEDTTPRSRGRRETQEEEDERPGSRSRGRRDEPEEEEERPATRTRRKEKDELPFNEEEEEPAQEEESEDSGTKGTVADIRRRLQDRLKTK